MQSAAYSAEAVEAVEDGLAELHAHDALANACRGVLRVVLLGGLDGFDDEQHLPGEVDLVEVGAERNRVDARGPAEEEVEPAEEVLDGLPEKA